MLLLDEMMEKNIKFIVIDACAFLDDYEFQNDGENFLTVPQVINEVRDKRVRQKLEILPFDIKTRSPTLESIMHVTAVSEETGDYRSLSLVDLNILALTYDLQQEFGGGMTDEVSEEKSFDNKLVNWKKKGVVGFYNPMKDSIKYDETEVNNNDLNEKLNDDDEIDEKKEESKIDEKVDEEDVEGIDEKYENGKEEFDEKKEESKIDEKVDEEDVEGIDEKDEERINGEFYEPEDDEIENLSNEEGWITKNNIDEMKTKSDPNFYDKIKEQIPVACATTDFAIQNVLIRLKIPILASNNKLLKRAKHFIYRCSSCFQDDVNPKSEFCTNCGHATLDKCAVMVDENGKKNYMFGKKKKTLRGTKYSLPAFKGGKHPNVPVIRSNQPMAQERVCGKQLRERKQFDVWDESYFTNKSPFLQRDTYSRAFNKGVKDHKKKRKNPNESKPKLSCRH
ncbi:hypothetical protein SNEBB_010753 [Seison nebaliae]|nr:hypothetical protein SNEBB_010753 [Seison nebaliae]